MTYMIDAWLERPDPYLRVTHKLTGIRIIDWKTEQIREMLDCGALCPDDFSDGRRSPKELVRELFLLACLEGNNEQPEAA